MRRVSVLGLALLLAVTRSAASQDSLSDTTRSAFQLGSSVLRRLPIDDARHALVLAPGVRLTGPDIGITPAALFLIRGSATGRGNVYVDGASLRFQTLGGAGVGLGLNAIEGLSVLSSVAPASLSDAGGGVLSYVTRSGGERLTGGLRWDSDDPFSDASTVGYNRLEGGLGGPLARNGRLTFFVSTMLQGQHSSYRGPEASRIPAYLPNGVDTLADFAGTPMVLPLLEQASSGLRRPLDWSTARRGHAKVAYRYGSSSTAALTLMGGDFQQRFFPGRFSLVPTAYTGDRLWSGAAILNVRHQLGSWRGGPLALEMNVSLIRHRDISGPLDSATELATRDPSLGIAFQRLRFAGADILRLPTNETLVRDLRTGQLSGAVPFLGVRPDLAQTFVNPYGVLDGSWPTAGSGGTLSDVAERRLQGRWMIDWRRSPQQMLRGGIDIERSSVSSYSSDIVRPLGSDAFTARPSRVGVFTENRLVLADAVIDIGLRYDRINPGGDVPLVPSFIASSGLPRWNPNATTDDTAYANSVARVFRSARTKSIVSPRIRFMYPIAPSTAVRLGYSRTVEPPAWRTFFVHSNNDLSFTFVSDLFGRDVDFAVTGLIEAGVHYTRDAAVLDVAAYRKELPRYVGRLIPFPQPSDSSSFVTVNALTLLDASHVHGIDVSLDWRKGWITASGMYSYAHVVSTPGTLTTPVTAPVTTHTAGIAISARAPDEWNRGTWLGSAASGASAVILFRAQNGQTFRPLVNNGFGTETPTESLIIPSGTVAHLPWFKRLDLRIEKVVHTGRQRWSLYLDARNLLNFANLVTKFAETADTANPLHRLSTIGEPTTPSGQYARIRFEASDAGALMPDGTTVDLGGCASWSNQINCVALNRVERRFGNGDQLFTLAEQQQAFDAYYRDFFGAWRFYAPGRTMRVGLELSL